MNLLQIHPRDNVAVALSPLQRGEENAREPIPSGHKMALTDIGTGAPVIKYGCVIGTATAPIQAGDWVHTHNMKTGLSAHSSYSYEPIRYPAPAVEARSFLGYLREDGRAATRNELWILPTVGCVNGICQTLAQANQALVGGNIDGLYTFSHPFGCSQVGEDHARTRRLLAALAQHPNAGGVLIVGLGCENLTMEQFRTELGTWDDRRVKFMVCQQEPDELRTGAQLLRQLADYASGFSRQTLPAEKLVVGLKCGGSDGLSGITANPTVGRFSDRLTAMGGATILTEVPEMFGAEPILLNRCADVEIFRRAVAMVDDFKQYYIDHHQPVYENPSPGNKAGGITTLEDKSCGCVQKGGSAPVVDILPYGGQVKTAGLNLLSGPGNDLVSTTALTAAGAHLILFTTGRGTPFGAPVPTLKISSNTALFQNKPRWIDFDAGGIARGEEPEVVAQRLFDHVLRVASGEKTRAEENGFREISIFKSGVFL